MKKIYEARDDNAFSRSIISVVRRGYKGVNNTASSGGYRALPLLRPKNIHRLNKQLVVSRRAAQDAIVLAKSRER
jgi:hypothetical protein